MPEVATNDIPFNRTARTAGQRETGPSSEHRVNQIIEELTSRRRPTQSLTRQSPLPKLFFIICFIGLIVWAITASSQKSTKTQPAQISPPSKEKAEASPQEKARQLYQQGVKFNQTRQFPEAVRAFSETLKFQPNYPYAYHNMAHAFQGMGNKDRALEVMSQAISQDSSDSQHFHCRGLVYFTQENYSKALEDFQTAINGKSNFAESYHMLGHTNERIGDLEKALSNMKQALDLEPNNERYKTCFQKMNEKQQATAN